LFIVSGLFYMDSLKAQTDSVPKQPMPVHNGNMVILFIVVAVMLVATIILKIVTSEVLAKVKRKKEGGEEARWNQYINNMDSKQIEELIEYK
jgi:hypothetical protein